MSLVEKVRADFAAAADKQTARGALRFFKTGEGAYAAHDTFCGIKAAGVEKLAHKYQTLLSLADLEILLQDKIHEIRSFCLRVLTRRYVKASAVEQQTYVDFYLKNLNNVNNWDLVDISAHKILGSYCFSRQNYDLLRHLANSNNLWYQRVAVVANWYLIKQGEFSLIKEFALKFKNHPHDLMHKSVGWMLREMGKQDEAELCAFLEANAPILPRTTLRYAIERLSVPQRRHYLTAKG